MDDFIDIYKCTYILVGWYIQYIYIYIYIYKCVRVFVCECKCTNICKYTFFGCNIYIYGICVGDVCKCTNMKNQRNHRIILFTVKLFANFKCFDFYFELSSGYLNIHVTASFELYLI